MTFRDVDIPDGLRLQCEFSSAAQNSQGAANSGCSQTSSDPTHLTQADELLRPVFGVLGIPVDVLDLATLLEKIQTAFEMRVPFLLSTPNVNFLMMSRSDADFRESLLMSDVCPADGMPILWIARLLGVPVREKLSGSDVFETLRSAGSSSRGLKVFLFGGAEGVADTVCKRLNAEGGSMTCVGALNPGFGSVAELSTPQIIETIASSHADLLTVFFSARKAQEWLLHNHERIQVPVRAQFGATINIQAGIIKRAPAWIRRGGFEWVWRIKEEPYLWRRYWNDGCGLVHLVLLSVLPLVISRIWRTLRGEVNELVIDRSEGQHVDVIKLSGSAVSQFVDKAIPYFRQSLDARKNIQVDLSELRGIDPRFFGLLLVIRRILLGQGLILGFLGAAPRVKRIFRLNGFEFLLDSQP